MADPIIMPVLLVLSIALVGCAESDCPTWTLPRNSKNTTQQMCKCGDSIGELVQCTEDLNVSVLMGNCMTYDAEAEMAYLAACPFVPQQKYDIYSPVPRNVSKLNDFVCSPYNRQGIICSECKHGYGPSVYTHNLKCYKCYGLYSGWALYLFFELFPITVLFAIMSIFHIRLTSSGANCLLFNVQMMVAILSYGAHIGVFPFGSTSMILYKILLSLYGIFNLDFFRQVIPPFCVDEHINGLHVVALQYLAVLYLLLLTLSVFLLLEMHYRGCRVTMWLWKNIFVRLIRVKQKWTYRTSLADSLATCLLLSYTRLMLVSFNLIYPVSVFNEHGAVVKRTLNFQQNIEFLSTQHLPFAFLGLAVLILLVILPPLLFIFYPMKCCQRSCIQKKAGIYHLVELFQGGFKDGTENTRDFRWFAIFYFVLRFAVFVTHIIGYGGRPRTSFLLPAIVLLCASLTILTLRPYKKNVYNIVDGIMLACASVMSFFQTVMVIIPNTTKGKLLQIAIQIGFFMPVLFVIFYSGYLCMAWISRCRQSRRHTSTSSEDSLPDRLLHPDSYTENQSVFKDSINTTSKYGTIGSLTNTE